MTSSILPTYARAPLSFVKGEGSWLIEADGRRFLDLGAGVGVTALGHANPELCVALKDQADELWHCSNLYNIPVQEKLADKLVAATFADTVFFTNSGTEACELAIKMARKYWADKGVGNRQKIIAYQGAFHGRSSAAIAAAGSEKMTKGFAPLLPGFIHLPFVDLEGTAKAAESGEVAAILIEPVQGEGGIREVTDAELQKLRKICDDTGTLLILDEVQCGMGRTGQLFAHVWAEITPDIMMVAKGLGGGFPLGAVLATKDAASAMGVGSHGSTYGGNPLACAVGVRALDIIDDDDFLEEVGKKAAKLMQYLIGFVGNHLDVFEGLRGSGLMIGLKCNGKNTDFVSAGYDNLLITVPAADNVVRLLPALTITDEEIDLAMERLEATANQLKANAG